MANNFFGAECFYMCIYTSRQQLLYIQTILGSKSIRNYLFFYIKRNR